MSIIFEIWPIEYLIFVLVATTIIALPMIIMVKRSRNLWQKVMEQSNVLTVHDSGDKRATDQYRKISVFSNAFFISFLLIHLGLVIWGIADYSDSGFVLPVVGLCTPGFIAIYIYSIQNVKNYNRSLDNRIIVKGVVSGKIEYEEEIVHLPKQRMRRAKITVRYTYTDPSGISYSSFQTVDYALAYGGLKKMRTIYYDGAEVDILLNEHNYRDSYLPIYETYSLKFRRLYVIPLRDW